MSMQHLTADDLFKIYAELSGEASNKRREAKTFRNGGDAQRAYEERANYLDMLAEKALKEAKAAM